MCGIAGIVNVRGACPAPTREALTSMVSALHHRGPDEFGIFRDKHAGLAHARLSIIDLESGQQPLANEDRSLWIVFNGEIFNFVELRSELQALGHRFRTNSDTEVIVHAYESWGDSAFSRMNGQWAVALWDAVKRRLVLARDRAGVRPLYTCMHRERLYFASEVKSIFAADASIPRSLDPAGIDQTFTFWAVVPPQSVFRGVDELPPGHLRVYEDGGFREMSYWRPNFASRGDRDVVTNAHGQAEGAAFSGSFDDAVVAVRSALEQATALRMLRSDVPVGSYLSGGLDSSLVAALGRRFARGSFRTFSLRFDDLEYDETAYQRLMVDRLGSEHHEVIVSRSDIARVFPEVVYHAERPILRTAPAPLFLLSRLVRDQGIKVVLTGEGADEMFAGYDLFREGKVRRFWARCPDSRSRPRLLERLYPYLQRSPVSQRAMTQRFFAHDLARSSSPGFAHGTRWRTTAALKRLFSAGMGEALRGRDAVGEFLDSLPQELAQWDPLAQDQYIEIRTLLSGYLLPSQGDRMMMSHSVEGRFPFLDQGVIDLAHSLPARFKLHVLNEKHVIKRAAHGLVPPEIIARKKQPYRAPDALSFIGAQRPEYVQEMLDARNVAAAGVFEPKAVGALLQKCQLRSHESQLSNSDNMALVGILSTQLLHHQYVANRPQSHRAIKLTTDVDRASA